MVRYRLRFAHLARSDIGLAYAKGLKLEAVSKLFAVALDPESGKDKAQHAENNGAIFKRCNSISATFRAQSVAPVTISAHFGVTRRSLSVAKPRSSRRELRENSHRRDRK